MKYNKRSFEELITKEECEDEALVKLDNAQTSMIVSNCIDQASCQYALWPISNSSADDGPLDIRWSWFDSWDIDGVVYLFEDVLSINSDESLIP